MSQVLQKPLLTRAGPGAYSISHRDLFSCLQNPAAITRLPYPAAGIYHERRFLLKEMNHITAAACIPSSPANGSFGARIFYSGIKEYNESGLGIIYGRQLNDMTDVGIGFHYYRIGMQEYGTISALGVECGIITQLTSKLRSGIYIANPAGGQFGKNNSIKLPSIYAMGIGFEASGNFFTSIGLVKQEDQPVSMNAYLQYKFHSRCAVSMGIVSATASVWWSISLQMKSYRIDLITGYHPALAFTPAFLLLYEFKKPYHEKMVVK